MIYRIRKPEVAAILYPYYVVYEGKTRKDAAERVYWNMTHRSDDTLVLVSIDEKNMFRAFMVIFAEPDHAYIFQYYKTRGWQEARQGWEMVVDWVKNDRKLDRITCNVYERGTRRLFTRKNGFRIVTPNLLERKL